MPITPALPLPAVRDTGLSEVTKSVTPKLLERKFDLKEEAMRESFERLAEGELYVKAIGPNRWEICDPDLVEHQFWGPGIVAQLKGSKTGSRLELSLHNHLLPQEIKRQWAWNLGTSVVLAMAVGLTAPAIAVWIVSFAFLGALSAMAAVGLWRAKTHDVLSLGDLASQTLAPVAHRQRRAPASATPYRCLNSELKAQAKRMRRASRRRFRFVLPWS